MQEDLRFAQELEQEERRERRILNIRMWFLIFMFWDQGWFGNDEAMESLARHQRNGSLTRAPAMAQQMNMTDEEVSERINQQSETLNNAIAETLINQHIKPFLKPKIKGIMRT